MGGNDNDEETYSDSDGGDRDYAISQTSPNWLPLQAYIVNDEHETSPYLGNFRSCSSSDPRHDNDLDAATHKPSAKMGKVSTRNRSDTMFAEAMRGVEEKNQSRTCVEENSNPN